MVYEYPGPQSRPRDRLARAGSSAGLPEPVRLGLAALLLTCWVIGACAGIVYWALNVSLLGVLLSATLPGLGAAWAMSLLQGATAESDRRHE